MTDQTPTASMPTAQSTTTESATISVVERTILGHNLDWWNEAMVGSLVLAGVFALAVAFATTIVVKLQRQVDRDTSAAFSKYKLDAEKEINDAKASAANAQLALEQYKAPRTIEESKQAPFIEAIKPSAGQEYMLSVAQGQEAANLVCLIANLLDKAGWKIFRQQNSPISVGTDCGPLGVNLLSDVHVRAAPKRTEATDVAATRLINALVGAGIAVHGAQDPVNVPNDHLVVIMVGAKL